MLLGCARDEVRFVALPNHCPPTPTLPTIKAVELEGLSDDAYRLLVERDLRLKEHIELLRVFCVED